MNDNRDKRNDNAAPILFTAGTAFLLALLVWAIWMMVG